MEGYLPPKEFNTSLGYMRPLSKQQLTHFTSYIYVLKTERVLKTLNTLGVSEMAQQTKALAANLLTRIHVVDERTNSKTCPVFSYT